MGGMGVSTVPVSVLAGRDGQPWVGWWMLSPMGQQLGSPEGRQNCIL